MIDIDLGNHRWITPSIFQAQDGSVVDEWTLGAKVPNAAQILQKHWDEWVTLADFQRIAGAGFNTVRIPIGCKSDTKNFRSR